MAQKDKDDLADALAALAAGDHVEPEAVEDRGHAAPPTPPPAGLRPSKPGAVSPPRAAMPVVGRPRPAAPASPPGQPTPSKARPPAPAPPVPQGRAAAPGRPPTAPTTITPLRPPAPGTPPPEPPPAEAFVVNEQPAPGEFVEDAAIAEQGGDWVGTAPLDDDAMLAPPPDPSQFGGPVAYKSPAVRRRAQGPEFRQTMIPILLTCGVLLLVFGALKFVLGPDSPYANLAPWVTIMVVATGIVLLGLAVFTMLQVRDQLKRAAEQKR